MAMGTFPTLDPTSHSLNGNNHFGYIEPLFLNNIKPIRNIIGKNYLTNNKISAILYTGKVNI